ncbi:helix-turn-helix domain-containing protein [Herbiconiux sp. CPCC 205716]|uniref:Helix-turn-helix domain-containing protein n=1 Tax=Herbiconiux gentiana TaxID=2970912 RepID=A0ABT2GFV8_9MICO|nr:helix-turn-helix domain-containing protein [Herbiconiux gentiana]MCS5715108.1 helix-turn-helix domain-containing protein [Herbiconiux gentiana]
MSLYVTRVEFAPRLMTREQAAYYLSLSLRDLDALREQKDITPKGRGRRVLYDKQDLDRIADRMPERPATRGQRS